jgi:hypothetical protein
MVFEFSIKKTFDQSIDIVDMGNTALRCTNHKMDSYYIIIKTVFGKTSIIKYGPVCPDLDTLLDDFNVCYKKLDYKESAIYKEIDKFINDYKKEIENIDEITEYEAWQDFPKIQENFENA